MLNPCARWRTQWWVLIVLLLLDLQYGDVIITFGRDGGKYIAKIRTEVSLYHKREDGVIVKIRICDPWKGSYLIYEDKLGFFNNALITTPQSTPMNYTHYPPP